MSTRRTSMADVAALAGVSGQTVSRVVNGSPRVDAATRKRVLAAMSELGYRPHAAARALRTGLSHSIGVVVSTLSTVGNSRMLEAVSTAAAARGYALVVVTLGSGGPAEAYARLGDQGVDGAIVLNEASALARGVAAPDDLRLVLVDSEPLDGFDAVASDHAGGARDVVAHLLAKGHATVWHLAGPVTSHAAVERERGWRDALTRAGADVPPITRGDWSAASGYAAGQALAGEAGLTAIFAANDQMALGLLRAFAESGRRVPQDVAVAGFDDVPDAAMYSPPLTTARQDFDALGELAVEALVARIRNAQPPAAHTVPTVLVERSSTARA